MARPVWRLRLSRELSRRLLNGLVVAGVLASMRFALDPPRPAVERATSNAESLDRAAEGFASLFARDYLTWDSRNPEARRLALARFTGSEMDVEAGMQPPPVNRQTVEWTEVVQAREPGPDEHVYTVAAQTDVSGLLYLGVGVIRKADGSLALTGYPAFVGAPASAGAIPARSLREVDDRRLRTMLGRAFRNYLAGASDELAADLVPGADVAPPTLGLALESVDAIDWALDGRFAVVVVLARDRRGTRYRLAYEVEVVLRSGRWEIKAIQENSE